ncbi:hypothetical protein KOR34_04690 [Posidoniimonas corsicana]|uniref:Lipoprotein n=1 Tax=Posidoniimonas corsicana TaxID=1938618 RepID=A0A5C5VAF2_9BACT|nr:hypothetical protein [Posidoniimonas corsicana]TWT35576.1 hypothetical protein KOR34_04690 [Posidoniimonas corsicana]
MKILALEASRCCLPPLICIALAAASCHVSAATNFDVVIDESSATPHFVSNQRVLMVSGYVAHMRLWESGSVEIRGGDIGGVRAFDSASVLMDGGYVAHADIQGTSVATVRGGSVQYFKGWGNSRTEFLGGSAGSVQASGYQTHFKNEVGGDAVAEVRGGEVGLLKAEFGGVANLHAGSVRTVQATSGGTLNVFGGGFLEAFPNGDAAINVYGSDFRWDLLNESPPSLPILLREYRLTGTIQDGTPLNAIVKFLGDDTSGLNLVLVPTPTAASLVALACVGAFSRRRR